MKKHVVFIVGSLRKEAISRRIADEVQSLFPENVSTEILEIRDLPLYDADYDNPDITDRPLPETYPVFRQAVQAADGVFFVTPENNRTIPAALKNAIDVGSKPNGQAAWLGKPAGLISHSVGRLGGYSSYKNVQLALTYFQMPMVREMEVFLSQSPQLWEGDQLNEGTKAFLQKYVDAYVNLLD